MIQFNLLPDVKLQYLKAARTRRLIMSISVLASAAALLLLAALLLDVEVAQKHHLSSLDDSIKQSQTKINKIPQLNKILTVQNQLDSLGALHAGKPAATRLFDYLTETTPVNADINDMTTDYTQKTISITGTADALSTVNQYVDTLKFTTYGVITPLLTDPSINCQNILDSKLSAELKSKAIENCSNSADKSINPAPSGNKYAFSNVVLSAFARAETKITYTITLNYDAPIFDITQNVKLVVPNLVTTRSELDKPNALFTPAPAPTTNKTTTSQ